MVGGKTEKASPVVSFSEIRARHDGKSRTVGLIYIMVRILASGRLLQHRWQRGEDGPYIHYNDFDGWEWRQT